MPDVFALIVEHGVLIVFGATLASRLGLPVPAAPFLVVAGGLSGGAQFGLASTLAAAIVASVIGDGAWFLAGRVWGYRMLRVLCRISMSPDSCVNQSEAFIAKWGGGALLAAKFLPGVSVVAPPMAGALGMSLVAFIGYEALSAAIWAGVFLGLGLIFSEQVQVVLDMLSTAGVAALVTLSVLVAAYLALRYRRRRNFLRATEMSRITVDELRRLIDEGRPPVVIDVRSDAGRTLDVRRIPGALAIELEHIQRRSNELPRDREIVLYCNCPNEESAVSAARLLTVAGWTLVRPLAGGIDAWESAGHTTETHSPSAEVATQRL